jgi:heme exporter protein C
MTKKDSLFYGLLAAFAVSLIVTVPIIFLFTPSAQPQAGGLAQKIFYFHVPVANGVYISGAVCFIASCFYLARPSEGANAWARAGSDCAAYFGTMVLCSGPLWAKKAWGVYWTWDPQLTTLLLSVLIYYAVSLLRAFAGDGAAERRFAAALGVMGAVNLPIIYYSVQKWGGNHPTVRREGGGGLDDSMKLAFLLGNITMAILLPPLLLWLRSRVARLQATLEHTWQEALTRGIVDHLDDYESSEREAVPSAHGVR